MDTLVSVKALKVSYRTYRGLVKALSEIHLEIPKGKIVALVGESGCGKSTLGLSIIRLLPPNAQVSGEIFFEGKDILKMEEDEFSKIRGTGISMIFQEPMSSLDPVYTVGKQLIEALEVREGRAPPKKAYGVFKTITQKPSLIVRLFGASVNVKREYNYTQEIIDVLRRVQISDPERVLNKYPHELSGGMAQRVMIAQALLEKPKLLIADEPTSALDVTSQAQVLELMRSLRDELGSSIIFITHDLAVAAQIADEIVVMYAGEIVERAQTLELFKNPLHPYTRGLLGSFPRFYREDGVIQEAIQGDVPNLLNPPSGCKFHPRCKYVMEVCKQKTPQLKEVKPHHEVSCFLSG
ncbi:hypothetical protein B9Q02_03600 [Candidatus Marsarchaeota G1 archaeon BE_D]|jgi:peptide/nickel transport system ATP-binding protein|uniref:ABC transporter domain-containing protein n=1 Tax=Candidatus Marsarchaeota G1 archaeon BE_D TaxID=1978156 RepID=A0A2R6AIE9_9ARCH|nr:MAG: hypothetical protein B9Q02_03600 [Candidatus Marsarchaeota G1 archaeon BE_D]